MEDILKRFRMNWAGYIRQYRVLLALTILAAPADFNCFRAYTRAYIGQAVSANRDHCFDGLSSSLGALYLRGCYHPLHLGGMV